MQSPKVLFILKQRVVYGTKVASYGLINSCTFIVNKLRENGIDADLVSVVDNNDIDREVTKYQPTHCFIEALWVVPDKFWVLAKLHPTVNWIIRLHSCVPFLATEGIAMQWVNEYNILRNHDKIKIWVAANNENCNNELNQIWPGSIYLPNIYNPSEPPPTIASNSNSDAIDIGCFGALRPLKNTLQQAFWSIQFAERMGKKLNFHVNFTQGEEQTNVAPAYKNLVNLFKGTSKHKLVTHDWLPHSDFLKLVASMDLGLQVSYTESFNIVAADFIYCHIPIVVSKEISWVAPLYKADPSDPSDVLQKMRFAYYNRWLRAHKLNNVWLNAYNNAATKVWLKYLRG